VASAKEIKDRQRIADHVADWMQANTPSFSIDTLVCRPLDALRMGAEVAAKSGRISDRAARKIVRVINSLVKAEPNAIDEAEEICRCAMSSRKRGELKRDRH
jgi:hypothetical protein